MKRSINFRGRAGKNLTAGNLQSLLDHYGVKAERTADGKVAVENWPKPRVSNPNFLSEELDK